MADPKSEKNVLVDISFPSGEQGSDLLIDEGANPESVEQIDLIAIGRVLQGKLHGSTSIDEFAVEFGVNLGSAD